MNVELVAAEALNKATVLVDQGTGESLKAAISLLLHSKARGRTSAPGAADAPRGARAHARAARARARAARAAAARASRALSHPSSGAG